MKTKYKIVIAALILVMGFNFFWYNSILDVSGHDYHASSGVIDLSGWEEADSIQELQGEWLYYDWNLLWDLQNDPLLKDSFSVVEIPENLKTNVQDTFERFGTYSLKVVGLKPLTAYGIYSREQVTAFRMTINDIVVMETGRVGKNVGEMIPEWKEKSTTVFTDEKGQLNIFMEISNFEYHDGIFWNAINISSPENIFYFHANQIISETILIIGFILIALLFIGLYLYIKLEKNLFYFAIFTLNIAFRLSLTSSRIITHMIKYISWNEVVRFEYLTGYLMLPLIVLFITELLGFKGYKIIQRICFIFIGLVTYGVLLTDHAFYMSFLNPFVIVSIIIIMIAIVAILLLYRKNRLYEIILVLSFSNFLIAMFKQLYGNLVSWVPIAIFNAVIGLSAILLNSFWKYIRENEVMAINAAVDPLTGLYNRHYFNEFGKTQFINKIHDGNSYLMFLDLDGFKKVNDAYGHDNGDRVLCIIGQRIRHCLRNDDLIFRYGGDEFVVLTQCEDFRMVETVAKRLIQAVREPIGHDGLVFDIGVSIGIIHCKKEHGLQLEEYTKISDNAMYKAKEKGGNCFYIA